MVFPGTIGYIMFRKGELNLGAAGNPDYNLLLAQMIQQARCRWGLRDWWRRAWWRH